MKNKVINEIMTDNPYFWDGYNISSTEFIDHLGKTLDKYNITKKEEK